MNEKMLEEILLIRNIKTKLDKFKLMSNGEKAVFLKALESYEFDLKSHIQRNNNNIELMQEDGIETDNKIVSVPIDPNNSNYEEIRNHGLNDSLSVKVKYLDNVFRSMSSYITAFEIPHDEEKIIFKSIRNYATELQTLQKQRENNAKYNSDIYREVEEYTPLSQGEMFSKIYQDSIEKEGKNK